MPEIPERIKQLIETFSRNIDIYKTGEMNETQLRREYIDPFFTELGWDVENKKGYASAYKDVSHEFSLKTKDVREAPDYCFRIGQTPKFFLEAKKPSVNVKEDIHPAFQVRSYAWSAKLPLSILTDFEEFAVYDCRIPPHKNDKASTARVIYFTYDQYIDKWEEISEIFSRNAILKGSFDKYIESNKKKKGTAEVDSVFLDQMEEWRKLVARNIALRNPSLSIRELNFVVQKTIDRIIFLRICEDRGIEDYGQLMALQNGTNVYDRLKGIYDRADEKYNSGLFHFSEEKERGEEPDNLSHNLVIDDKVLKDIFNNLYYPESPYEFSVLPSDILGQVYEQFLGKVIRLTPSHQAVIEDKPEVKKAGGVYYTPTYIVNYIVENTLGKLLSFRPEGEILTDKQTQKIINEVSKLKILDPACGSGSFLIGAFQYLLNWHLAFYTQNEEIIKKYSTQKQPAIYQASNGDWLLTTTEKKRILLNNIYGVDIDSQAVEVTKLSLLLKVLEGESEQTISNQMKFFRERALPDLSNNIKCGNSLIGPDFYDQMEMNFLDDEEKLRINVFDWETEFKEIMEAGGFDVVIGNPPYDVLEKDRNESSWPHEVLTKYVRNYSHYNNAIGGKLNLFRFFIVKSYELIKETRYYGMIVPLALLADISCKNSRAFIFNNSEFINVDCFPQKDIPTKRIFLKAKLSTVVIISRKITNNNIKDGILVKTYPYNSFKDIHKQCKLYYLDLNIIDPINLPVPLIDQANFSVIKKIYKTSGVFRLGDILDFEVNRGEINQTIYREYITLNPIHARLLKGVEIKRFGINKKLSQGVIEWFDENQFLKDNNKKKIVDCKRIATQRITGVDEKLRIVATLIEPKTYFADSTNSIILNPSSRYNLKYLLALLNSKFYQWRFRLTSTNNNVGTNELKTMPFKVIDFDNPNEVKTYNNLVLLTDKFILLNNNIENAKTPQEKAALQRQIDVTDKQIDQLVYQLYGLTEDEIKIVEGD